MNKKLNWIFVGVITFIIGVFFVSLLLYQTYLKDLQIPEEIVSEESVKIFAKEKIVEIEQEIYSIILKEKYSDSTDTIFVIAQNKVCIKDKDKLRGSILDKYNPIHLTSLKLLQQNSLDNFLSQSSNCSYVKHKFNISAKIVLVTDSKLKKIFKNEEGIYGWKNFYETFPDSMGLIEFSNIGFNPQNNQAVLYVGRWCGGKCGEGKYYLLNKIEGKWVIMEEVNSWVS